MTKSEIQAKIRMLKGKLDEMRQYKRVLEEDGLKPDASDKVLESELIVKLLRFEKMLAEAEGRPIKKNYRGKNNSKEDRKPSYAKKTGHGSAGKKKSGKPKSKAPSGRSK